MKVEPYNLRLRHAPRDDGGRAYERFFDFISGANDAHVSVRPEQVVRAAIQEQNLFFLEDSKGKLVGTTGFYRHGDYSNLWAEIGSTLIHPAYRGFQLQRAMYRYIITHEWLAAPDLDPVIAVVDDDARASSANIEQCGLSSHLRLFELLQKELSPSSERASPHEALSNPHKVVCHRSKTLRPRSRKWLVGSRVPLRG